MNETIQRALKRLQNADYSGYFKEMEKIVPANMQVPYKEHKGKFIAGQTPYNFYQLLDTFANEVNNALENNSNLKNKDLSNQSSDAAGYSNTVVNVHVEGGKAEVSNSGNSSNTNTNKNTNKQTINFEQLEQKLPDLQSELGFMKEELEGKDSKEAKELLEEVKKLLKNTEEVEAIIESKDEKKIKKVSFWKRLGNFGKKFLQLGMQVFAPDYIKKIGKVLSETAKIGDSAGINIGFNHEEYANYGSE